MRKFEFKTVNQVKARPGPNVGALARFEQPNGFNKIYVCTNMMIGIILNA